MSQIQYGGRQTGSTYISGSILDSGEIPKATPMFPWTIGAMACMHLDVVRVSGICRIQYGGRQTASSLNLCCIIARNVILKATTMFSRIADTLA